MRIRVTASSPAAPATLWEALSDLAAWPQWCPAFTLVQPDGAPQVGTEVRVVQPDVRPAVWLVDEMVPGRSFRWHTHGPGFVMVTEHLLEPVGPGTRVTLSLTVTGLMGWAAWLIVARAMRRCLRAQATALAARPNPAA